MSTACLILLHLGAFFHLIPSAHSFPSDKVHARSQKSIIPKYPYDENTTKYCGWWLDNDGAWTCARIEEEVELSLVDFHEWNPSISLPCDTLPANQSFCIAANVPPWPKPGISTTATVVVTVTATRGQQLQPPRVTTETETEIKSTTITSTIQVTTASTITSSVTIHAPLSISIVTTTEYREIPPWLITTTLTTPVSVTTTETKTAERTVSTTIYATRISTETAVSFSVSVLRITSISPVTVPVTIPIPTTVQVQIQTTKTTTATATATKTHLITTTALSISTQISISTSTIRVTRTSQVLSTKTVQVISTKTIQVIQTQTETPPTRGKNGIPTPVPPQPDMVPNCITFYYVRRGDTCESVAARHRIGVREVVGWNPYASSRGDCTLLLADYWACVGVL